MKLPTTFRFLIGLSFVSRVVTTHLRSIGNKNNDDRRRLSPSYTLMTKPCTLIYALDGWDCMLDRADANGTQGFILPMEGWYLPTNNAIDDNRLPVITAVTTMYSPEIQIDINRIYVPPGTRPIFERPPLDYRGVVGAIASSSDYARPNTIAPIPPTDAIATIAPPQDITTTVQPPLEDLRPQDLKPIVATHIGDNINGENNNNTIINNNAYANDESTTNADSVHNCTNIAEQVYIVMGYGTISRRSCTNVGHFACDKKMPSGFKVFHVCTGTCAKFPSIRDDPEFPACGTPRGNLNPVLLNDNLQTGVDGGAPSLSIDSMTPALPLAGAMAKPCTLLGEDVNFQNDSHQFFWRCEVESGIILPIEGYIITTNDMDDYGEPIISGVTTIFSNEIKIEQSRIFVPPGCIPIIEKPENYNSYVPRIPIEGDKSVLVVRVIGADVETSIRQTRISNKIFGERLSTSDRSNSSNFKRQVDDCSFNQTRIIPGVGPEGAVLSVYGGVVEIMIENTIRRADRTDIANAVSHMLKAKGFSLPGDYHHIVFCLPPGTLSMWSAYSFVNHWSSVYNDDHCISQGHLMHNIGHNLGLSNAEEHHESGDQSNAMGHPAKLKDGPKMCYNGPHSYRLGWYEDKQIEVNPATERGWRGNLVGIVDYQQADRTDTVIVKITTNSTVDYYVTFNRLDSFNNDTFDGENHVLVHKIGKDEYNDSLLMAKLGPNCVYSFWDTGGSGQLISIKVNAITGLTWGSIPTARTVSATANVDISSRASSAGATASVGLSCPSDIPSRGTSDDKNKQEFHLNHTCVDDPSGVVDIVMNSGTIRRERCDSIGGGLCKRKALSNKGEENGSKAFDVCPASCAQFPAVLKRPDFPECGLIRPSETQTGSDSGI